MTGRHPSPTALLLLSSVLLLSQVETQTCPYRSVGRGHSMCTLRPRACPGSQLIKSGGTKLKDVEIILNIHNQLRALVARGQQRGLPAADNMELLEWDQELATVAQRWADQCTEGHDNNRDVPRFEVGQNVAVVWTYDREDLLGEDPDWETQIRSWYDEIFDYGFSSQHINPFRFKASTGHLTQLLWGETNKIGCGYAYYYHRRKGYSKIYVCNYGPGGNVVGGAMYDISRRPSCTKEDLYPSPHYTGLCVSNSGYGNTLYGSYSHDVASPHVQAPAVFQNPSAPVGKSEAQDFLKVLLGHH